MTERPTLISHEEVERGVDAALAPDRPPVKAKEPNWFLYGMIHGALIFLAFYLWRYLWT